MSIVYCTLLQFITFGCPGIDFGKVGNYATATDLQALSDMSKSTLNAWQWSLSLTCCGSRNSNQSDWWVGSSPMLLNLYRASAKPRRFPRMKTAFMKIAWSPKSFSETEGQENNLN